MTPQITNMAQLIITPHTDIMPPVLERVRLDTEAATCRAGPGAGALAAFSISLMAAMRARVAPVAARAAGVDIILHNIFCVCVFLASETQ